MPSWYLEDADLLAAKHPYTFYKPSRALIARVRIGEVVKLMFRSDSDDSEAPNGERMWVRVTERPAAGGFRGRLDNHPRMIRDLHYDDLIEFQECHVIDTERPDPDSLVARFGKRCFVSQRILRDGERIGYLYREEPDEDDDSGWRFTANDESDDYLADRHNIVYVSIGHVLNQDDSCLDLLDYPCGAAFIRNPQTGQFEAEAPE